MEFFGWLVCCGVLFWCCGVLFGGFVVCFFVIVGSLRGSLFFNRSNFQSKCQLKHSSIFPFLSLKSQDLPTVEVQILTGPFQSILNPIFKLPHDTFPSEKADFGS